MNMRTRTWALAAVAALAVGTVMPVSAQRGGGGGRGAAAPEGPPTAVKLEVAEGSKAIYRVREQLAGINFPSDAVGETTAVTGVIVIGADGRIDTAQSKISVDLRTLRSDQDMRDGYIRGERGLNTEKFPMAEFVPRRAEGLPWPFPSAPPAQAGFQLVGDMTVYGKTEEVTWDVVATFSPQQVAGRAITTFTFEKFGIPKPSLARLMSVDDNINLELELRLRRSAM
jgi:polyisoprenoid-binding protein YceI